MERPPERPQREAKGRWLRPVPAGGPSCCSASEGSADLERSPGTGRSCSRLETDRGPVDPGAPPGLMCNLGALGEAEQTLQLHRAVPGSWAPRAPAFPSLAGPSPGSLHPSPGTPRAAHSPPARPTPGRSVPQLLGGERRSHATARTGCHLAASSRGCCGAPVRERVTPVARVDRRGPPPRPSLPGSRERGSGAVTGRIVTRARPGVPWPAGGRRGSRLVSSSRRANRSLLARSCRGCRDPAAPGRAQGPRPGSDPPRGARGPEDVGV